MKHYTRDEALDEIRQHCPNKFGFEYAFAQTSMFFISDLMNCIDNNIPMDRSTYVEPIDFLDGNGFKVEGNSTDGYIISYLNN